MTTLLGMMAGVLLKVLKIDFYMTNLSNHFVKLFMLLLLPPIIFESGFNMDKKSFFKNMGSVLMFSFVGTFIAIFASSFMFYFLGMT